MRKVSGVGLCSLYASFHLLTYQPTTFFTSLHIISDMEMPVENFEIAKPEERAEASVECQSCLEKLQSAISARGIFSGNEYLEVRSSSAVKKDGMPCEKG